MCLRLLSKAEVAIANNLMGKTHLLLAILAVLLHYIVNGL